ncbi:MAG: thiamine-binding protein [Sinobacteraceae bacterium]|nr:thiamine-binding protein [Nevskiaceae bacterium]MBV9315888.1 thiamine-binding protein [Gammaproteobacteria bacterium]
MDIGVEISLYPLRADFVPAIHEFLERLERAAELRVVTNSMSTQVFGPYDTVMQVLREELRTSFEALARAQGKAVFVMKVLGPLPPA